MKPYMHAPSVQGVALVKMTHVRRGAPCSCCSFVGSPAGATTGQPAGDESESAASCRACDTPPASRRRLYKYPLVYSGPHHPPSAGKAQHSAATPANHSSFLKTGRSLPMAAAAVSKALAVLAVLAMAVAVASASGMMEAPAPGPASASGMMEAPAPGPASGSGAIAPPLVAGLVASVAAFLFASSLRH
ncbi:hypothetical protein ACP70R_033790 [Stipagrostis hirtigluma subsp. patula]